jgi:spore coat protein U-like protein
MKLGMARIRSHTALPAFLLMLWNCFVPQSADAQTCSASMTNINFGSIDVTQNATFTTTGTFSATCTGSPNQTVII